MYVGWMTLGEGHPLDPASNYGDEIINNDRTLAYARHLGLGWLSNCEDCEASDIILSGTTYQTPISDPAPWWDDHFPQRAGFCGVFGVDVTGVEDSTASAQVTPNLAHGGVIGATRLAPKEFTVRALAVADGECALQEGIAWYQRHVHERNKPCQPAYLTFFYCCPPLECRPDQALDPCPCDDMTTPGGPCWPDDYAGLKAGCGSTWWPTTYAELKSGPPTDDEWCHWVYLYYELRIGANAWSCGAEACVVPYVWHYNDAVVTDGPNVVSHRILSNGAYAELEFTITTGDPAPHRMMGRYPYD